MTDLAPPKFGMGARVRRVEDEALIRGEGRYTTDVKPAGTLVAFVLRSPLAHARFDPPRLEAARKAEGVKLVWTAADVADMAAMPCLGSGPAKGEMRKAEVPILCEGVVRHVGDAVAFVVADTIENACAAAELIEIDYEPLPVAVGTDRLLEADTPLVWPEHGTNLAFEYEVGDAAATDDAFAKADKVARLSLVNNRLVCNYIEPRAIVAEYDPEQERWTLTVGSQGVHGMRKAVAKAMQVDPSRFRVVTPEVGGGFGPKIFAYREYPLAAKAAAVLGQPVRWVCDRNEHFQSDAQGRDNIAEAAMALDQDGRILAMKVDLTANMGAYLSQFGPYIPWVGVSMTTGLYDIDIAHASVKGVYSNTVPVDAYRGAGRPEAAFLLERLIDEAARVVGLAPDEIRRRNFIRPEQLPYGTVTGRLYDTGEFAGHLERALEVSDHAGFETRAAESKARGRLRGIGMASYVEACAFAGSEPAKIVLEDDGHVALFIGTQATGQGHRTAYAQFVAERLGLDLDQIRVHQGDTDELETGGGTGGSRSIPLGGPSVRIASDNLAEKLKDLAADALEAAAGDIELSAGEARIVGTDRAISFADLAARAGDRAEVTAIGEFKQAEATYPNGTHVCELEIDPETGSTRIERYTIVDDFGVSVNPLLLEGQVHGGVAQSIGQVLLENTVYDEDGQLLTASFSDYAMPRAWDTVSFHFETRNVPSTHNALGIKGAGEAGTIGATPAVMNAVVDALYREYGIRHLDLPATPLRVWNAIQAAKAALPGQRG
ncbi:xanthine dehydrogenase family protein molybdopterin-binding subunit [Afifella sp. JA880]|uniref:xanthine dehydrogenase family protein molybdopterin-binding subunit n=1 Tax=Afifella sp. JA880 TaxID=2975280 RepID=UPI0021BB76CD|nr:xanthine dehydrogenase family protein molybdopterin-binding subunit [Afifella sp. JA880]MCT8267384.1 xanthine dehydrogenase family protein molybdopterin-binding subunit [Afifella sp. JA880]